MLQTVANIYWLGTKELRSFLNDFVLLGLVIYAFSLAIVAQAQSSSQEVHNASIAIVDEDHSELSRRIAHAFLPPYFQTPQPIAERDIVPLMNSGRYTFVIDVPPNFQRDVLGRRQPAIQLNVDATAMVQAGLGADYAQQIMMTEINDFISRREGNPPPPVNLLVRIAFNPNVATAWFTSVMGIINSITMLAIILAGAAVVREREHGTMDHLLVMPLTPFEIAMSKIWANSLVIVFAVGLSLRLVVHGLLGVPIAGSIPLFLIGAAVYLFFCDFDRHLSWNPRAVDAAARLSLPAGISADEHALGQQHAARKHAGLAGDHHAGITLDAFRFARASDPLSRGRLCGGLAGIRNRRINRRALSVARLAPLPASLQRGLMLGIWPVICSPIDPNQFGRLRIERRCTRAELMELEGVMTAPELMVVIGIIAAFTTFAAVLAWVSRNDGRPVSPPKAVPARANLHGRVDQIGRARSA